MGITGGFGTTLDLERGTSRQWVMGHDGKKRWADNDAPCNPHEECSAEIERLDKERKYWLETAAGYAQELSGIKNDYQHPLTINGVTLDELEDAVKNGYQISTATQLDMIALVRRIMTPNATSHRGAACGASGGLPGYTAGGNNGETNAGPDADNA